MLGKKGKLFICVDNIILNLENPHKHYKIKENQ